MADRILASDSEREHTVAELSSAQVRGLLTLDELQSRTATAHQARTRGQLRRLTSDLPADVPTESSQIASRTAGPTASELHFEPPREKNPTAIVAALHPRGMGPAWTIWAAVSGANLLLWLLISVISAQGIYPWFIWVAGPWGFALLVHSLNSRGSRHDKGSIGRVGTTCHVPPSGPPVDPQRYRGF